MCAECRQIPCHPRCPNADEPHDVMGYCSACGNEIYFGESVFYRPTGSGKFAILCEDCIFLDDDEAKEV